MLFKQLRIKNFMAYRGDHTPIDFPAGDTDNVMLIWGNTGGGKSSFFNAIRWVLCNEALDKHAKPANSMNILNWDAARKQEWECKVEMDFSFEGRDYTVLRRLEKRNTVATPKEDSDFKTTMKIKKGSDPLSTDASEQLLSRVFPKGVSRFRIFDAELLQQYSRLVGAGGRREQEEIVKAIEEILGVPSLTRARKSLETLVTEAQKEHVKAYGASKKSKDAVDDLNEQLRLQEIAQEDKEKLERLIEENQDDILGLDAWIENNRQDSSDHGKLEGLKTTLTGTKEAIQDLENDYTDGLGHAWQEVLRPLFQELQGNVDGTGSTQIELLEQRGAARAIIDIYKKLQNDGPCDICGSSNSDSESLRSGLEEEEAKLEDLNRKIEIMETDVAGEKAILKVLEEGRDLDVKKTLGELNSARLRIYDLDTKIKDLKTKLEGYDSAKMTSNRNRRDGLLEDNGGKEGKLITLKEQILDRGGLIADMQDMLRQSSDTNEKTREADTRLQITTDLYEVFRQAVETMRENLKHKVEKEATEAFRTLRSKKNYDRLKINESYGLMILDKEGNDVRVGSAGEEEIVALSLIQALNQTATSKGPLIIDNPLMRLDANHKEKVVGAIPAFSKQVVLFLIGGDDPELSKELKNKCLANKIASEWTATSDGKHSELKRGGAHD